MLQYEQKYWSSGENNIAGIDEAGRGPLAGPVVSASVILPHDIHLPDVNDSKKLSEKKRERLFTKIFDSASSIGIGVVHEELIDEHNILQATFQAMRRSIGNLSMQPDILLVDGNKADIKHYKQESIIDGDQKSLSIAAASIIAKVTRDRLMREYDIVFPEYGFANHKGYGTKQHIEAIESCKASPIHRQSFNPVRNHLPNYAFLKRNHLIEKLGEQLMACYYIRNNCKILEMNYNDTKFDEINLISQSNNNIIFTEVQVELANSKIEVQNIHIEETKQSRVLNIIENYMDSHELNSDYRFEIGQVILKRGKPEIGIKEVDLS